MSNQLTIEKLLEGIAKDFLTTTGDIIVFSIMVVTIIIVFILLSALLRSRESKKVRTSLLARYEELIRKYDLTINELDLIDEMSEYLRNREKKYLLLTNRPTFLYALQELKTGKAVPEQYVSSIAAKVGISENLKADNLNSTKKLAVNTPVKIEITDRQRYIGLISGSDEESFTVNIKKPDISIPSQKTLSVYVCNFRGIHFYRVSLINTREKTLRCSHSDSMEFVKSNANLNVYIQREGIKHESMIQGKVISFWKGGALLTNPDKKLRKDDDIRISFIPSGVNHYFTNAEVVKNARSKTIVEVRFKHLL